MEFRDKAVEAVKALLMRDGYEVEEGLTSSKDTVIDMVARDEDSVLLVTVSAEEGARPDGFHAEPYTRKDYEDALLELCFDGRVRSEYCSVGFCHASVVSPDGVHAVVKLHRGLF